MNTATAAIKRVQRRIQLVSSVLLVSIIAFAFINLSSKTDALVGWQKRFSASFYAAKGSDFAKMKAAASQNPLPQMQNIEDTLTRDLRAGELLLKDEDIRIALRKLIGVERGTFIGTGRTLPKNASSYLQAIAREQLVLNLPVDGRSVWGWKFEPSEIINTFSVKDLLDPAKMAPYALSPPAPSRDIVERHTSGTAASSAPLLVRFSQFNPDSYKNRLGREECPFVFMIHYDDVANVSLHDAANLSGHLFEIDTSGKNACFVWLYVPTNENGYFDATWPKILELFAITPERPEGMKVK